MKSEFIIALTQLAAERNLPKEIVLSAIEAALVSAYKRDSIAAGQNISVKLDPVEGEVSVYVVKTVTEEVEDPLLEITLADARKIKPEAEIGEMVPTENLPHSGGRIAAQTAKQVVIQRLREAEREIVFQEFADKEGEVFTVTIQKMELKHITVELGRAEAILPPSEQAPYERYRLGMKLKVLLQSVRQSNKGPEIIVSRTDTMLLKRLFEMEVPEIYNGAVEIMNIAREAGARSKVAVFAKQDGVDAVGSCVGLRGIRIQNIVNELHGEKIDVVQWQRDPAQYISRALSPSMVMRVDIDEEHQSAVAVVPENQLSLAIGKEGQNARLAARLTGWKVDIKSNVEIEAIEAAAAEEAAAAVEEAAAVVAEVTTSAPEVGEAEAATPEPVVAEVEEVEEAAEEPVVVAEVEEPAAVVEVVEAEVDETPVEEEPVEVTEADILEEIPFEAFAPEEREEVAVGAVDRSKSIEDLPAEVWAVRNQSAQDPGVIRFREDIVELGDAAGPRRGRRRGRRRSRQIRR
jgi:N utilization substance protein A